jgi:hypothetical protein
MNLATPSSVQKLQKALHDKAKESPGFRFYALYDKVYRKDVLAIAYQCCKANGGAAGVDDQSFENIEEYGSPNAPPLFGSIDICPRNCPVGENSTSSLGWFGSPFLTSKRSNGRKKVLPLSALPPFRILASGPPASVPPPTRKLYSKECATFSPAAIRQ